MSEKTYLEIDTNEIATKVQELIKLEISFEELEKMLASIFDRMEKLRSEESAEDARMLLLKEFYPLCCYMMATSYPWYYTKTMMRALRSLVFILENQKPLPNVPN